MNSLQLRTLEKKVTDLSTALANLSSGDDLRRLILLIKRPGWTTPAEYIFASAIVDSMLAQTAGLTKLKGQLMKGGEKVIIG